jgi:hypothetical protein
VSYKSKEKDYEGGSSSGSWNNLFQGEKNNTLAIHYRSSSFSFLSVYLGASMRGCRVNRLSVFLLLLLLGHVEFLLHPPVYVCARRPKGGGDSFKDTLLVLYLFVYDDVEI